MRFNKAHKLHSVIAKPQSHRIGSLSNALILPDGRVVGTNGVTLAVVPGTPEESDDFAAGPRQVPREAIVLACKGNKNAEARIELNGEVRVTSQPGAPVASFRDPETGEFPRWDAVLPAEDASKTRVSINARLLAELAQALGAEEVTLEFRTVDKVRAKGGKTVQCKGPRLDCSPIRVTPVEDNGAEGAIMPVSPAECAQ